MCVDAKVSKQVESQLWEVFCFEATQGLYLILPRRLSKKLEGSKARNTKQIPSHSDYLVQLGTFLKSA